MKKLSWVFLVLMSIGLFGVTIFFSYAPKYMGQSYFDSRDFQSSINYKIDQFGPILLNRLNVNKAIENLKVEPHEIDQYRNHYGSKMDQIESIQFQYQVEIDQAINSNNEIMINELETERDTKIADIRANFASDEVVKEKILIAKKEVLRNYEAILLKEEFTAKEERKSFAYDLTNLETNERFTYGDITTDSAYKNVYNANEGYLYINSIKNNHNYIQDKEVQVLSIHNLSELIGDHSTPFKGTITIPTNMLSYHTLQESNAYNRSKWFFILFSGMGVIAAIGVYVLYRTRKIEVLSMTTAHTVKKLNFDGRMVAILITLFGLANTYIPITQRLEGIIIPYHSGKDIVHIGFLYLLVIFFITIMIVQFIWLFNEAKNQELKLLWEKSFIRKLMTTSQSVFVKRSVGVQIVILIFVVFLAGLGLGGVIIQPVLILAYTPLFTFIAIPALYILFKRVGDYNKLAVATEEMSKGQMIEDVKIRGKSVLAEHAKHLNTLREGVRISQSEQAKSERLKTELITNVSHDLRTPLTSIITYTDLLKKEDLTHDQRMSYVAILDRKSQRLKTLIEDLFEVSKMASGNMELQKQHVDLKQLMQQALAEHDEEIQGAGLDFRVSTPDKALIANVDGQKWWRVLDNLIVNAIKYTMPGTRVYVTLKETNGCVNFIIKNVTKYELGENVDELFERFKRSDTSRHTEGSGLGLAIAQSIVDLHGGSMNIEVDGDLFKVSVSIKMS